ncbi:MAG: hypothetical protein II851_02465 [Bacteroidales bacterium]|nr:hypothetical protein [Bacteroidales bacterium]
MELPEVFCIVISWTRFIGQAMRTYEVCTSPKKAKEISGKEARALIEERGLVKVYETNDGSVWDTPDRAFYEKYKGYFRRFGIQVY